MRNGHQGAWLVEGVKKKVLFDRNQICDLPNSFNWAMPWFKIETAPFEHDIEVAVMEHDGPHAVVFPCRRVLGGWVKANTLKPVDIHPTHWREWSNTLPFTSARN